MLIFAIFRFHADIPPFFACSPVSADASTPAFVISCRRLPAHAALPSPQMIATWLSSFSAFHLASIFLLAARHFLFSWR